MPDDKMKNCALRSAGFTLVELMIALAIGAFILGQVYLAYVAQKKSSVTEIRVTEMQQNLRASVYPLIRNLRMAGYDPTGTASCAGFTEAVAGSMDFSMDLNGNGSCTDSHERIQFAFSGGTDANKDGIPDDGSPKSLGMQSSGAGGYQPIGENIESFEFRYLDEEGNVTTTLADIRAVQVSLLARVDKPDRDYVNNIEYNPASGTNANWKRATTADNFRRRLLITTVFCRNMGL